MPCESIEFYILQFSDKGLSIKNQKLQLEGQSDQATLSQQPAGNRPYVEK
jgi:hypothetical protein